MYVCVRGRMCDQCVIYTCTLHVFMYVLICIYVDACIKLSYNRVVKRARRRERKREREKERKRERENERTRPPRMRCQCWLLASSCIDWCNGGMRTASSFDMRMIGICSASCGVVDLAVLVGRQGVYEKIYGLMWGSKSKIETYDVKECICVFMCVFVCVCAHIRSNLYWHWLFFPEHFWIFRLIHLMMS